MKPPPSSQNQEIKGCPLGGSASREFPNIKARATEVCCSSHLRASSALEGSRGRAWKMVLTGWSRQRESTNIALLKMGKKRNKWGKMLKGMEKKCLKG